MGGWGLVPKQWIDKHYPDSHLKEAKQPQDSHGQSRGLRDLVGLFISVCIRPSITFAKQLPVNAKTFPLPWEHFHTNRNVAQMTKIKMYSLARLAVLFKTITVWFCFHIAMETLLKGFNTIYCVKLKKKSVSLVLENKASRFLPTSVQGVMDANCGRVTSHSRRLSFLGKHSGDKWTCFL